MTFTVTTPDENFDRLKMISNGGGWELGLTSVLLGVRVRLGRVGEMDVQLDYCAGADRLFQLELLNAVRIILLKAQEDIDDDTIINLFPGYTIRPINLDPTCWPVLQRLRDGVRRKMNIEAEFLPIYGPEHVETGRPNSPRSAGEGRGLEDRHFAGADCDPLGQ